MQSGVFITKNNQETKDLGKQLAGNLLSEEFDIGAVVLALEGDLGGGKTTFLQGLAEGLGVKEKVLSPTFVIQKHFNLQDSKFTNFYHLDCYRLNSGEELKSLGFLELLPDNKNIIAVEWSERVADILPSNAIFIKFKYLDNDKREISIN